MAFQLAKHFAPAASFARGIVSHGDGYTSQHLGDVYEVTRHGIVIGRCGLSYDVARIIKRHRDMCDRKPAGFGRR